MKTVPFIVLFLSLATSLMARAHTSSEWCNTGNPQLDSLLVQLNHRIEWYNSESVGKLDLTANIHATSWSEGHRWWTPLVHDLLPFDYREGDTTHLDATVKAAYQTPCDLLLTPLMLRSDNNRRNRRILHELYPVFLPIYSLRVMRDKGDDKHYILPFTNDGLRQYRYQAVDTTLIAGDTLVTISFKPKKKHHELLEGQVDVYLSDYSLHQIRATGQIDFGQITDTLRFSSINGYHILHGSSVSLDYRYGKMRGHNYYNYNLDIHQFLPKKAFDPRLEPLDLSDVYAPQTETSDKDTIGSRDANTVKTKLTRKKFLQKLPSRMVSSSSFEAFGSDVRIYGPLNPAFIGFDHINGVTLRQRMRFSHLFQNGQSIRILPEAGYAFRLKELRYRFDTEWNYMPEHRGYLLLRLQNGSNGFSSRFKSEVNKAIRNYRTELENNPDYSRLNELSFDSLGLRFFRRYEFTLEHGIELTDGLLFNLGTTYSIRRPVKHGIYASAEKVADATIENRYLDMNPYLRLSWTPHQYYYREGRQKFLLRSAWPTFIFEAGQGVKNFFKSRGNYTRLEFDSQQLIPIGDSRNLSWHFGAGGFIKQREEYFVNYTHFSRSQYPSTWDRRANGGTFALLDDYWYSSSASYAQGHIMYESPFLLCHRWGRISKYVIKERVYVSSLWAQRKNLYGELGYGIGNNYFNVSLFMGFMGDHPVDVGAKFSIELDQHL